MDKNKKVILIKHFKIMKISGMINKIKIDPTKIIQK